MKVYGTSRSAAFPVTREPADRLTMIPMDVRDAGSVRAAVEFVLGREGRVDALVNNAGFGLAGAVEDTTSEEALEQLQTNFFGVHRVCRAVLPAMRSRGSGLIVNVGSIAGRIALPFEGLYSASKHAVAALSDSLRMEVAPFGVRVTLLEPGDFRTDFTANRQRTAAAASAGSPYSSRFLRAVGVAEQDERNGADPRELAQLVARLVDAPAVRPRYLLGLRSQTFLTRARCLLPDRWFERLLMSHYRV
jgi:NAD(P)-dependent dehydrogenase (short-subunit alcohol dehydrogenase family)